MFRFLRKAAARINRYAGVSVRRTYLYRRSKPVGWSATAGHNKGIEWELLSPERVGCLQDIGEFDVNEGLERFRRGDRCYTVWMDGRLAHYGWAQVSGSHLIEEAGLSVAVSSGEFWIYNGRTVEWARRKGIYTASIERIVTDYFEIGYHTVWIYTSRENIVSQKGILRTGFTHVQTLTALRVGGHYFRLGQSDQGQ